MANPPSGFWPVREKEITLSVAAGAGNIVTEGELGVKPDGVFNTHTITVVLTDDGSGSTASVALYGATAIDADGAFVWTDLATDKTSQMVTGDSFVVNPRTDGIYKAFKLVTASTAVTSKAYIRSAILGL